MERIKPNFKSYGTTIVREAFCKQVLLGQEKKNMKLHFYSNQKKINNTRFISSTA